MEAPVPISATAAGKAPFRNVTGDDLLPARGGVYSAGSVSGGDADDEDEVDTEGCGTGRGHLGDRGAISTQTAIAIIAEVSVFGPHSRVGIEEIGGCVLQCCGNGSWRFLVVAFGMAFSRPSTMVRLLADPYPVRPCFVCGAVNREFQRNHSEAERNGVC